MARSKHYDGPDNTQIVIRMTSGIFYGLIATVIGLGLVVVVFLVGMRLGSAQNNGAVAIRPVYNPAPAAVQPAQPQAQPAQAPAAAVPAGEQPSAISAGQPAGSQVPVGDNPRLALPDLAEMSYVMDFGETPVANGPATRETLIRNTGVNDLVIADVQTTCSCTQASVEQSTIPPGGETVLRVTHDPQAMLNHGSTTIAHQILINSNDPAAPWVEFDMAGTVTQ
jgi:hypothetical protein